jgi:quercetin dioxygenase-like cupin family protein
MAAKPIITDVQEVPYDLHRLPHLGDSLLQVLIPAEVKNLWQQEAWDMESGRSARTLVKYPDLRIVLVSMKAGARMTQHKTNARFAILTLAGHVRLHLPHTSVEAPKGELLAVDRDVAHDVEAIQQSTFLLIIAWPGRAKESSHD